MIPTDQYKAKKELEEARKAGTLPPEQDAAGNFINPHIPEFMAKAPWYLNQEGPGLQHQRKAGSQSQGQALSVYQRRGEIAGQATKYRKGACKNCGSMTHTEKECTDRPRKVGAWKTGRDIKHDEVLPVTEDTSYDAKRDRYNGDDSEAQKLVIAQFEIAEAERKRALAEEKARAEAEAAAAAEAAKAARAQAKAARAAKKAAAAAKAAAGEDASTASEAGSGTDDEDASTASQAFSTSSSEDEGEGGGSRRRRRADHEDDGVRIDEAAGAMAGTRRDPHAPARALRVREDIPKYLLNLDVNSAFYDPKTRSMRENPFEGNEAAAQAAAAAGIVYQGDNAWRTSGLVADVARTEAFAWEAAAAGGDVLTLQSNPTQLELLKKLHAAKKDEMKAAVVNKVVEHYLASTSGEGGGAGGSSSGGRGGGSGTAAPGPRKAAVAIVDDDAEEGFKAAPAAGPVAGTGASSANAAASGSAARSGGLTGLAVRVGGDMVVETVAAAPRDLLLGVAVQEGFREYTLDGKLAAAPGLRAAAAEPLVATGEVPALNALAPGAKANGGSKYKEDVYPGNHSSVWGSWFDTDAGAWGYACCRSTFYRSICTAQSTGGGDAKRRRDDEVTEAAGAPAAKRPRL